MKLQDNVRFVRGIGPKKAELLGRLGIVTLEDAVQCYPRGYEDRTHITPIRHLLDGEKQCVHAVVGTPPQTAHIRRGMDVTRCTVYDESGALTLRFFNHKYAAAALETGKEYAFYGKVQAEGRGFVMLSPEFEPVGADDRTGRVLPVYPLTAGLYQRDLYRVTDAALAAVPDDLPDFLPKAIREQQGFAPIRDALAGIHRPQDMRQAQQARRRMVFEEFFLLSCGMGFLRARRSGKSGAQLRDLSLNAFYRALPFSLTGAQMRAIEACTLDIAAGRPLSRLIQGDVGSGKTMVAAALCYLAAKNGRQAVMMAPTELLAQQHMQTLAPLLQKLGVSCGLLVGSMGAKQKRETVQAIEAGEVSVVIGTHAVLGDTVQFHDLAVAIVDEQHRFGVNQRATLTAKGENVHLLVMSATPIPRTLALLLYGDLDVSVIDELPPGRQKIKTYAVGETMRQRIDRFIDKQCAEGGQVYVVCPLVGDGESGRTSAESAAERLSGVLPHRRVALVHGRTRAAEKEQIMADFAAGNIDILVSTTVIEVGVNVPNATLMVVEDGDCFGLSQLHQLRGRVGRGKRQSYCVFYGADRGADARERLKTLVHTNDGFVIAQKDLEMRGAGDFFGTRQHGLPPMKLADLAGDTRVLEQARRAADALLADDPELVREPELRARVEKLFAQYGEGSFN
ncbi:ATP-dependent DNA helicase RecG [Butyricicoccus porcorum]|uniref:ATP-dependent DNA helicase RecG n=1 Tax=Butyricicoccus porcorum TaxID=1945634 RepID=A0A252F3U9_9FIRM|nr:ATP-dependent DNA helicase RecG [Butyricicoccus porcorum]MCI6926146.1 ATP-dependent DNA helicase RecG [Butyricicoccus porcorum]MDD6987086.1 ATP-dependent DNA helicase RecG [Butyricicoccus porcorum]MDY4483101.1 ATP-dependent DNA helicase RecG [Butyricicoccus porcorum]OUM20456.1 ATP-dependent DNA helicase RecG [Butyricicoccus porcorum]